MAITKVTSSLIESGAINAGHVTGLTSAHIAEGSNLYYTDARSRASISVGGSDIAYNSSTGVITGSRPTLTQILAQGNSTGSNNILVSGSQKIQFNSDLEIYNNGSSSIIKSVTDTLYLNANSLNIADQSNTNGVLDAGFAGTGVLRLKYQGNVKLQTTNTGVTITGTAVTDLAKVNSEFFLGSSSMGKLTQSGSDWIFQTYASGAFGERFRITDAGATVTDDLTVLGNLNLTGDINSYNVTDLDVVDKTITLGKGQTEANSGGSGIVIDGSNASILWDESTDVWDFNKGFEAGGKVFFKPTSAQTGYALFDDGANGGIHIKADTSSVTTEYITTGFGAFEEARFVASNFVWKNSGTSTRAEIDSSGNFGVLEGNMLRAYRAGNSAYAGLFMDSGEKLYIRNSWGTKDIVMLRTGEVGIGTSSPDRQLELEGQGVIRLNATGSNTDPGIDFNTSSANDMQIRYRGGTDKLAIYSYGTSSDVLTIQKADGHVGIGTTSPEAQMELYKIVDGDAQNLLIMNQKSYGVGTGTNERASINLGIAEASTTSLNRLFGNIHVRPYNESDSSHGIFSFGVRGTGAIRDDVLVLRGYSSTDQRVGIGTNDPDASLEVKRSSDGSHFRLARNGVGSWDFKVQGVPTLPGVGAGALELIPTVGNSYFAVGIAGGGTTLLHVKNTGLYTVDGSAASPAYSFNSDSDTGFYRPSSNALGLVTGGVERMRISSGGDVSVNGGVFTTTHDITTINKFKTTNSNTRAIISMESKDSSGNAVDLRLHALGDGPRGEIYTYTNHPLGFATNNAAPQMTLDTGGRLGINQTPLANNFALQVTGLGGASNDARAVYLKGTGNHTSIGSTGPTLVLQNTDSTANNIVKLSFESASSGETVSINAINTNHSSHYGDMVFNTRGSGGYSEKLRIHSNGDLHLSSGAANKGYIQLSTQSTLYAVMGGNHWGYLGYKTGGYHRWFGSDGVEDMRLDNSGNLGIGGSPNARLDISASVGVSLRFSSTYNYGPNRDWQINTNNYGSSNWGGWSLEQSTAQQGTPSVARIGVHANGNVGINMGGDASSGLTSINPATALHVGGDITVGSADAVGTSGTAAIRFQNDNERSRITSNYASGGGGQMGFWTDTAGGTLLQRVIIDNDGRVGINRAPAISSSKLEVGGADNVRLIVVEASGHTGGMGIKGGTGADKGLKLFSGGQIKIQLSDQTNVAYTADGLFHSNARPSRYKTSGSGEMVLGYRDHGSGLYQAAMGLAYDSIDGLGNTAYRDAFVLKETSNGGQEHYRVSGNGNVTNTNNSYGQISDERLKTDITDASSQWDDIKAVRVRKFKFGTAPEGHDFLQIGVISQELEASGMVGLIEESDPDSSQLAFNPELVGERVKTVKYSVLYMKAIKALQEAMTRIEALEARVTELE